MAIELQIVMLLISRVPFAFRLTSKDPSHNSACVSVAATI
ncbi:hypothetical protein COLO4_03015 [Corchorus olitorius]|uniref:Uncharacterized protein n=1 Tax=Corchorus olitorius TaxID=93759 RepID=A0A1R3KZW6_9ROSI|nr:hypothetical protein COLO4_03015 [Corchorus olitorius]